jgi:hypothetical protein
MSLLRLLESDRTSLVMEFLNDHAELLQVARAIRNSPTFAWAASTHGDFTLNKVDAKLRTDALCRRAMMHYMSFKFPNNFIRVWSGVPKDMVKRQEFVWFFQGLYISRLDDICKLNQVDFDNFYKYEAALEIEVRVAGPHFEKFQKILQRHSALNSRMFTAYGHVMDESKFVRPTGR